MKKLILLFIYAAVLGTLAAQGPQSSTALTGQSKDNAWEVGVHAGHIFSNGNIDFIPGYGGGIHVRRALDYVFALRLDMMYGTLRGEDQGNVRSFETDWMSGSLQAIVTLNNLKWTLGERKTNIYVLGGLGINSFSGESQMQDGTLMKVKSDAASHADLGAGLTFRISNRLNFGIEHKATFIIGSRSDLLDGVQTFVTTEDRSTFKDVLNYTSARLNVNLGNFDKKSEPLYWVNPLDAVISDINRVAEARTTLPDSDNDGVTDQLDEEENTPAGATVNTKGVTLDSDGDGIADHQDKEPYSPSGYKVDNQGVAQVPDVRAELHQYVDEKLGNFTPATPATPSQPTVVSASGIYLPGIYFAAGSARISDLHVGTAANIAQILKSNPNLRLVVTGHADQTGSESLNRSLSYHRAAAAIEMLTGRFGIDRNRLVLQYKGESELLAPGMEEVNRRVEFRVARSEKDMEKPAGK